jgi:hypothetical protein
LVAIDIAMAQFDKMTSMLPDIMDLVHITRLVSVITDADAGMSQRFELNNCEAPNLTECCQQEEKRANHDPLAFWKEDPSSPYNHNIVNNPLGTAGRCISDGCKMGNWGYNTMKGTIYVWISCSVAVAASDRTILSDKSMPMLFTNRERITIVTAAIHVAQYMVARVKLRVIKMNIANVGQYLSPRRLQTKIRPPVKSRA